MVSQLLSDFLKHFENLSEFKPPEFLDNLCFQGLFEESTLSSMETELSKENECLKSFYPSVPDDTGFLFALDIVVCNLCYVSDKDALYALALGGWIKAVLVKIIQMKGQKAERSAEKVLKKAQKVLEKIEKERKGGSEVWEAEKALRGLEEDLFREIPMIKFSFHASMDLFSSTFGIQWIPNEEEVQKKAAKVAEVALSRDLAKSFIEFVGKYFDSENKALTSFEISREEEKTARSVDGCLFLLRLALVLLKEKPRKGEFLEALLSLLKKLLNETSGFQLGFVSISFLKNLGEFVKSGKNAIPKFLQKRLTFLKEFAFTQLLFFSPASAAESEDYVSWGRKNNIKAVLIEFLGVKGVTDSKVAKKEQRKADDELYYLEGYYGYEDRLEEEINAKTSRILKGETFSYEEIFEMVDESLLELKYNTNGQILMLNFLEKMIGGMTKEQRSSGKMTSCLNRVYAGLFAWIEHFELKFIEKNTSRELYKKKYELLGNVLGLIGAQATKKTQEFKPNLEFQLDFKSSSFQIKETMASFLNRSGHYFPLSMKEINKGKSFFQDWSAKLSIKKLNEFLMAEETKEKGKLEFSESFNCHDWLEQICRSLKKPL